MSPRLGSPIIIIGAGGSGSTLLDRMLGGHPEILMKGEMRFLVADAWRAFTRADANLELWKLAEHFDAHPGLEADIKRSSDAFGEFKTSIERAFFRRQESNGPRQSWRRSSQQG